MLRGCAEPVLAPQIQAAAVRLLNRMGFKAEFLDGESCCGALSHHMGQEAAGVAFARRNLKLWTREIDKGDVAAVLTTASGCGVMLKDYGFIFRDEPEAEAAATLSRLACDISEFLEREGLPERVERPAVSVAYHAACSLQHGQKIIQAPKKLLAAAGFVVRDVREGHLCCGSAGTYNILQPEISSQLLDRKLVNIEATQADVVAAGNIGCLTQIASRAKQPVIHTVELLDWATGGPRPQALSDMTGVARPAVQARAPRPGQRDERKVIPS
jgi:glycolate oxidase iron-sulfur subunit